MHKIVPYVDYKQWLKCLNTQLNEPTNQNLIKVPKVGELMNKKALLNFGDQCNKQLNVLSLPAYLVNIKFKKITQIKIITATCYLDVCLLSILYAEEDVKTHFNYRVAALQKKHKQY